jgi:hypothetical protein
LLLLKGVPGENVHIVHIIIGQSGDVKLTVRKIPEIALHW